MTLRRRQSVRVARLANRRAGLDVFAGENFISIEADAGADAPCPFASVTEREAERKIRHARLRPDRAFDAAAVQGDFDDVAVLDAEFARGLAADEHRVVPGQLGDGIGQLLHPAVVRVTPVVHFRVAIENDFETVFAGRPGCRQFRRIVIN